MRDSPRDDRHRRPADVARPRDLPRRPRADDGAGRRSRQRRLGGRLPDADTYPYVHDVGELLRHGTLPVLGNVQSFGGFNPPGDAFLFLPGALLFRDVRLWESPSAVAFYVALVVGAWLLLRRSLPLVPATFCAAGLALSAGAIETSGTLWTRMQSPAFLIWTLLFLVRWAERRNAWWLAAALMTWAASLYVFPETLLAGVLFPTIWWLRRPPIRVAPVALAAVASVAMAWPYLAYESRHGFADLARIVTQQTLPLGDVRAVWCDPARTLIELGPDGAARPVIDVPPPTIGGIGRVVAKAAAVIALVVSNATRNGPAAPALVAALAVASVGLARGAAGERSSRLAARHGATASRVAGVACLLVACTLSLTLIRRLVGDRVVITPRAVVNLQVGRALLAAAGVALLARPARAWASRRVVPALNDEALGLVVWPTLAMIAATLALATPGRPDRGWQLWPLVVVASFACLDRWLRPMSPGARRAVVATLACGLAINGSIVAHARAIARDGWRGPTPPLVALLDAAAADATSRGATGGSDLSLGVHTAVTRFEFMAPPRDARARVGAGEDAYLLNRYGLTNQCRCREGFGDGDALRIVGPAEADKQIVSSPAGEYDGWTPVASAPPLRLLRRPGR